MRQNQLTYLLTLFSFLFICSCTSKTAAPTLFTKLSPEKSGIHFNNTISENDSLNRVISEFAYMGGGVGIGDFNNDGLKDIFFSGNQVPSRLYINKGNNQFEDITEKAGISTDTWCTGVSVVDINNDGFDDIFVCVYGKGQHQRKTCYLFINQHNLTFREQAAEYGLADSSYASQVAFFDYDKDGDLDMYLLNYRLNGPNANNIYPKDLTGHSPANDKLYRNDGNKSGMGHPVFTDVSMQAGIIEDGYGLGVSVCDYNNDGWPDIYVSNDFVSNDVLWINNKNGTFTNHLAQCTKHQSYSSMGSDAADINNDGLADIATLDMMPEDNKRKKLQYSFMNYERYESERSLGYTPEFMRNMLQLNNGNRMDGDTALPFFSEIGQLAGISETDWSWSVLMADFNNDGWKDVHITNGIGRDFINADFVQFSTSDAANMHDEDERRKVINKKLAALKHVMLPDYLYLNNGNCTFTDYSQQGGINELSLANGAAYADLDNDGDLDIITNNINEEPFIFINNTIQKDSSITKHYLSVSLKGDSLNHRGFGAKVVVYTASGEQVQEEQPVRGYLSSVDVDLLFGLGKSTNVDSLLVIWPNDKYEVVKNIKADQKIVLQQSNASAVYNYKQPPANNLFKDVTIQDNIAFQHKDVPIYDFATQRLLPQKYSQLGPFISTGDVNNDGVTDFFIGNGFNAYGDVCLQQKNGTFTSTTLGTGVKMEEDEASVLFDVDGDGDLDLLVTNGDMRYEDTSAYYKPRLYINNGKGNFTLKADAIPDNVRTIAGCVTSGDFDGDGNIDVFIGGRVSKRYPVSPRSYLLKNNKGRFTDVTEKVCPALKNIGMVTAAAWVNFDNNKLPDLVITGEWMAVKFFKNTGSSFTDVTNKTGLTEMDGMWRSLAVADIDGDGDMDIVVGNYGLNNKYHVTAQYPMKVFAKDIDGNGSMDPILFYSIKDVDGQRKLFPAINRDQFAEQVPSIKKQFLYHENYSTATFDDIFKGNKKDNLQQLTCNEMASCWLENKGNGTFTKHVLPVEAQFSPVNAIICTDFDNDGITDILVAGNEYQTEVMTGMYDASYGLFLKGSKDKTFKPVSPVKSGFIVDGDVKSMALINNSKNEKTVLVGINNEKMKAFKVMSYE
ncbi:VCBS repeat-containing protein [Chitinophagaceae bacterium 26-R-25]|nr:VCBS repeat-containing protein [Chitinophagaceae bacterium 26-R-25]